MTEESVNEHTASDIKKNSGIGSRLLNSSYDVHETRARQVCSLSRPILLNTVNVLNAS